MSRSLLDRLRSSADEGMTLIELMVALVVFGVASTGIAYAIIAATNTVRLDQNRVQAANLAARELEITRTEFVNDADAAEALGNSGTVTNPHALPTGSGNGLDSFTVTRTVQWVPAGAGSSVCDGGSAIEYPSLAVDVVVTWPRMGNVQPVQSHTILTPPKNSLDGNLAFLGVKVLRADGSPAVGQAVQVSGPSSASASTASDGCAVFSLTSFGTYTAKLATTGYVDNFGISSPTKSTLVKKATMSQLSFYYDRAATLTLTATAPTGYALPASLPRQLELFNTSIVPDGVKPVTALTGTAVVGGLWPFTDGYAAWSGSCAQSDPATSGGAREPNTVLAPGGSESAALNFYPVTVHATNVEGTPLIGATIVVNPVDDTGCLAPEKKDWVVGVTGADGALRTSLPAGSWTVSVLARTPDGDWPTTPSLVPGGAPAEVTAQISTLL